MAQTIGQAKGTPQLRSQGGFRVGSCLAKSVGLVGLMLGSWLSFGNSMAIALPEPDSDERLMAQQVVDGLPPPPPLMNGYDNPAQANLSSQANYYLVYVNGNSPLLLDQVQRIESSASVHNYQGQSFIQAGIFQDPSQATSRVQALSSQGIGAEMVQIPGNWLQQPTTGTVAPLPAVGGTAPPSVVNPVTVGANPLPPPDFAPLTVSPREVEFGRPPSYEESVESRRQSQELAVGNGNYFVVIPGRSQSLMDITSQVIRLGSGIGLNNFVMERTEPLGPHVMVGPFVNRGAASRWSEYFQDFGMDARVYFRR